MGLVSPMPHFFGIDIGQGVSPIWGGRTIPHLGVYAIGSVSPDVSGCTNDAFRQLLGGLYAALANCGGLGLREPREAKPLA